MGVFHRMVTHIFDQGFSAASERFVRPFVLPRICKEVITGVVSGPSCYIQVSSRLILSYNINGLGQIARVFRGLSRQLWACKHVKPTISRGLCNEYEVRSTVPILIL